MHRSLLALAAVATVGGAFATSALAQSPPEGSTVLTFRELEKGSTFRFVDNAPKTKMGRNGPMKVSAGDMVLLKIPLADGTGARVGTVRVTCTAPAPTKAFSFDCLGVFRLTSGDIWVTASLSLRSSTTTGAIIGGTRSYAGARGYFTSTGSRNSIDTLILLP
jgi:hypothetical protein